MRERDVLVVGAGFTGLLLLDRLRALGHDAELWEAGDYFLYVDERLGLRRDIRFSTRLEQAGFDDATGRWVARAEDASTVAARFLALATGVLARPYVPDWARAGSFRGAIHQTAEWPEGGVPLEGRRLAVGTGASGVQVVQEAAGRAARVTVFQRTPAMAMPMRRQRLGARDQQAIKAGLPERLRGCREHFAGFDCDVLEQDAAAAAPEERDAVLARLWAAGGLRFWLATFRDVRFDRADTWYLGANVPGKRREMLLYPGGLPAYRAAWAGEAAAGYPGFAVR